MRLTLEPGSPILTAGAGAARDRTGLTASLGGRGPGDQPPDPRDGRRARGARAPRHHRRAVAKQDAVREDAPGPALRPLSLLPEPGGPPRVLAVGEVLPELTAPRRAPRSRSTSRGRSSRARRAPARRLPRPRAVRAVHLERGAAPLPRPERGDVPRAHRADPLHPARPPRRRARLRTSRRPPGQLRATAELLAQRLPRRVPHRPPRRRAPARPRPEGDGVHIVVADEEERGALRLALRALRRLDTNAPLAGDDPHRAGSLGSPPRCAPTCGRACGSSAAARRPRRPASHATSSWPRPRAPHRRRTSSSPPWRRRRARGVADPGLRGAPRRGRSRPAVRAARPRRRSSAQLARLVTTRSCVPACARGRRPAPRARVRAPRR